MEFTRQTPEKCFTPFEEKIDTHTLPTQFTYPFNYTPHPLCQLAAKKVQRLLIQSENREHLVPDDRSKSCQSKGKMFGVLVVKDQQGTIGYLTAVSGNQTNSFPLLQLVPPIFDLTKKEGFFRQEEAVLTAINQKIKKLETSPDLLALQANFRKTKSQAEAEFKQQKKKFKQEKAQRDLERRNSETKLNPAALKQLNESLIRQSQRKKADLKRATQKWHKKVSDIQQELDNFHLKIARLKGERKNKSAALQQKLFNQYQFLNIAGEKRAVVDIFAHTAQQTPPAGAGDCAAPKLLQYAFDHKMQPIAMAEFWWGSSPKSEIRRHGYFYPACKGKCQPILTHMLSGLNVEIDPERHLPIPKREIKIIYEDDQLLVINKPADLLSTPGKNTDDSVYTRMQKQYPAATGPLVVHRLDMSTSGLLLIAKTADIYKMLQSQFVNRTVTKRYVAILEGLLPHSSGTINLPLRVDFNNRPYQLVCYEFGKTALTKWKTIEQTNHKTRVYFYPVTGRTHQLRVHAAHKEGLNTPIAGDELYGKKGQRLLLHAESLTFQHPVTKKTLEIQVDPEF